jgi:hypothetical protein
MAGGEWLDRLSKALVAILGDGGASTDQSKLAHLLSDIRAVFNEKKQDALFSADLISSLTGIETSPWAESKAGKPITQNGLARLLSSLKVRPKDVRIGEEHRKGYQREDFKDAWDRYLPPDVPIERPEPESQPSPESPEPPLHVHTPDSQPRQPGQGSIYAGETHFSKARQAPPVAVQKNEESPIKTRVVADVTDESRENGKKGIKVDL